MIKKLKGSAAFVALGLSLSFAVFAGETGKSPDNQIKKSDTILQRVAAGEQICGTDKNGQVWMPSPGEKLFFDSRNAGLNQTFRASNNPAIAPLSVGSPEQGEYIIPVVFHIYGANHNCNSGGACVPDSVVQDALRRTNEDFQGLNNLDGPIAAQFRAIRQNMNVEFVLARTDPWGNPTNGIVRHGEASGYGNYEAPNDAARAAKNAEISGDAWDNYRYMNIYIMTDLNGDNTTGESGVAWYPTTSMSDAGLARVVYNGAYMGNNTNENSRSILTHEFGHWLNLPHVFYDKICGPDNEIFCAHTGDSVCDTPQMALDSLANNAPNCLGQPTNTENFMHYTDNYAMFTQQQAQRMYAALNHPARQTLWKDNNLASVGLGHYAIGDPHNWDGSGKDEPPRGQILQQWNGLSAGKGAINTYTINVPNGTDAFAVYLDGFSEDPDMYLRHGQAPSFDGTNWTYDLKSFNSVGSPEFIGLVAPQNAGSYHVTVHAFSAYTNARLMVVAMDDPTLCQGCEKVVLHEEYNMSAVSTDAPKRYAINVPADATRVIVEIPGGYGSTLAGGPDPDLYVSHNSVPTTTVADCKPFEAPGLREGCEFTGGNLGGTYNIMIVPFLDYTQVALRVIYEHPASTNPNLPPVANANGPYSAKTGTSISFSSANSSDPDGRITGYLWSFGDGNTSVDPNPVYTYASAGSYNVTLKVTDDGNLSTEARTTATVSNSQNTPPTANANGPYSGKVNTAINFSSRGSNDTDGNIVSYSWDFGDGSARSSLQDPSHTYTAAANYTVTLTVTDNANASTSIRTSANVTDVVSGVIKANPNGPYTGTVGNPVNFSSAGSGSPDGIAEMEWDFGDGNGSSTAANPSYSYSAAGTYEVMLLVVDNAGAEDEALTTVTITDGTVNNTLPVAQANGPYAARVNEAITFSSSGSYDPDGQIVRHEWNFGDGQTSSLPNPTHTYTSAGNFTATLKVTDNKGGTHSNPAAVKITTGGNNTLPDACAGGSGAVNGGQLDSAVPVCVANSSGNFQYFYFYLETPAQIQLNTGHGSGDVAMYHKHNGYPNDTTYDHASSTAGNSESISFSTQLTGWHYVTLAGSHNQVTLQLKVQ